MTQNLITLENACVETGIYPHKILNLLIAFNAKISGSDPDNVRAVLARISAAMQGKIMHRACETGFETGISFSREDLNKALAGNECNAVFSANLRAAMNSKSSHTSTPREPEIDEELHSSQGNGGVVPIPSRQTKEAVQGDEPKTMRRKNKKVAKKAQAPNLVESAQNAKVEAPEWQGWVDSEIQKAPADQEVFKIWVPKNFVSEFEQILDHLESRGYTVAKGVVNQHGQSVTVYSQLIKDHVDEVTAEVSDVRAADLISKMNDAEPEMTHDSDEALCAEEFVQTIISGWNPLWAEGETRKVKALDDLERDRVFKAFNAIPGYSARKAGNRYAKWVVVQRDGYTEAGVICEADIRKNKPSTLDKAKNDFVGEATSKAGDIHQNGRTLIQVNLPEGVWAADVDVEAFKSTVNSEIRRLDLKCAGEHIISKNTLGLWVVSLRARNKADKKETDSAKGNGRKPAQGEIAKKEFFNLGSDLRGANPGDIFTIDAVDCRGWTELGAAAFMGKPAGKWLKVTFKQRDDGLTDVTVQVSTSPNSTAATTKLHNEQETPVDRAFKALLSHLGRNGEVNPTKLRVLTHKIEECENIDDFDRLLARAKKAHYEGLLPEFFFVVTTTCGTQMAKDKNPLEDGNIYLRVYIGESAKQKAEIWMLNNPYKAPAEATIA